VGTAALAPCEPISKELTRWEFNILLQDTNSSKAFINSSNRLLDGTLIIHCCRGKPISVDHHTLMTIMLDCKKAGLKNENYSRMEAKGSSCSKITIGWFLIMEF
jgi:hypothetical protein